MKKLLFEVVSRKRDEQRKFRNIQKHARSIDSIGQNELLRGQHYLESWIVRLLYSVQKD